MNTPSIQTQDSQWLNYQDASPRWKEIYDDTKKPYNFHLYWTG
jgi:hypothetical protein